MPNSSGGLIWVQSPRHARRDTIYTPQPHPLLQPGRRLMRTRSVLALLFVCTLVAQVVPGTAQQPQRPPQASTRASTAGTEADLLPDEPVVTQHSARING